MAYDLAKVTANGNNLIAQILANKSSLSVDKIEISDTQLPSTTDISTMTSVPKVVQTVSANGFSKNSNTLIISTVVDNSSISADYKAWVFGIWGSDSQNGQSQLIAVITSTNSPDTIPAFSGSTPVSYTYKFNIGFSNASQIQFNMIDDSFATNDTVVHTTGDETIDGQKKFKTDPTDSAGNAYAKTIDVNQQLDKKVNVSDMRKPASDVAGIEEVNAKQDKIGYTPADDSKVVHTADTSNWQKYKLTGDDGSAKLVIASGEDVDTKLKAIIGTKDTGKLLVDINAKNNPTGYSLIGEYFCDFDGLVTGYGIGPDGAMWSFTYNGTTTTWKWSLTAKAPGIPSLTAEYDASKKGFDYTVTAPKSDGGSEITGYSLEYQKQGGTDWTKVALKPDSLTGTVTDGIEAGSDYLFRVNAENAVGSSEYFTVSDPLPTVDGNIYGASWDGSSSGALQRTDAAVGLKAGINGAQNDFDTRGPWGLMDKTVTDSYGNVFVRVPKFYIRKTQNKPLSTWQVSLVKQGDDWYLPNCFYDFDNKKELDYVDVSRYEGSIASGKLQSKTGVTPTASQTIVQLRSSAVANNTDGKKGYHLWDVHTLDALQVLFTIEFATLDSQSIMKGNTDNTGNTLINNGATDNVKGSSGFITSGATPMTYRGIENLYGNLAMWTDGLNINNLSLYSCDDATKYVSDTFTDPYYKVSYPLISSTGQNIAGLGFDKDHPGVTAPTSFNSDSYNTYYHDYGYVNGSGNYVVYTGGSWDWRAGISGLWCWGGDGSSTLAYSGVGSRLLKKAL